MTSHDASIRKALPEQVDLKERREHCSVEPRVLAAIGCEVGQQVRIERSEDEYGLYTVSQAIADVEDVVRMGLRGRQRLGTDEVFAGAIDSRVPDATLSDADAERLGELIERLDERDQTGLVVIAPHGGDIEPHTDEQAEAVASALAVSCWRCKGWHHHGANAHWHITAADIKEASFPLLARLMARRFTYAVAFHGLESGGILIGGSAPTTLKHEMKGAILVATSGSGIDVRVAGPDDVFGGDDPDNIVNRLTVDGAGGIQIEQCPRARSDFGAAVAAAVVDVFRPRL